MTDQPAAPPAPASPDFNDPDAQNGGQDESGTQAQDVARDARHGEADPSEESERGGHPDRCAVLPDDTPDLVETMNGMVRSGRIDMDAFAGEEILDDGPEE